MGRRLMPLIVAVLLLGTVPGVRAAESDGAALLTAIRDGEHGRMTELLQAGAAADTRDAAYMEATALMLAVERDDTTGQRLLLEAGADVDARDQSGDTALNWAAYYGYEASVRVLLEAGADPALTGHGNALEIALRRGHEAILTPLARRLGGLREVPPDERLVVEAVVGQDTLRLAGALAAGGPPDARDALGRPVLHLAAARGSATVVAMLLAAGADVDAADGIGFTPLMSASREARTQIGLDLLAAGADLKHRARTNGMALTPLHTAAIGGDRTLVEALLHAGADIDARDVMGNTPAVWALYEGRSDLAAALVAMGSDPDQVNDEGMSLRTMAEAWGIVPLQEVMGKSDEGP